LYSVFIRAFIHSVRLYLQKVFIRFQEFWAAIFVIYIRFVFALHTWLVTSYYVVDDNEYQRLYSQLVRYVSATAVGPGL
jgi:hypothetical protein